MNAINSQTSMLKTGYVYLAVFLLSCLTGVFFGFSGAIDDVAVGYAVQGFEPVEQNVFTGIFFEYEIISLILRVFMLAAIAVFVLNVAGIRKFIPALIISMIIAANPYLIAIFRVQAAFAVIPAMFFGLLAVVLAKNIKSSLKYLSYVCLLISSLFMLTVAVAIAFIVLMYQMLPIAMTPEAKPKKAHKKHELIAFFVFFALLILEQILLGDYLRLSLKASSGLFGTAIDAGTGAMFFFFPFIERLNALTNVTSGTLYFLVFLIISLGLLIKSVKPLLNKKVKLKNVRENLTAFYWSLGLMIFLIVSALIPELSAKVNTAGIFVGAAILICIYVLSARLKFKQNMTMGLLGAAFLIVLILTSVLTHASWADKETLVRKLVASEDYGRYAKAQLAEILYEKAQNTNNPQKFDEYHREFKELYEQYMQNPYVQTTTETSDQPVNTSRFAELDIVFDIHEILRLWDAEYRRAVLNLPLGDTQKSSVEMLNPKDLFTKHAELAESLDKKIKEQKEFGYTINFEFYNALISMLPSDLNSPRFEIKSIKKDNPANCVLFPQMSKANLILLSLFSEREKISDLELAIYSRLINTLRIQDFVESSTFKKFADKLASTESENRNFEILKTLEIADLLIRDNNEMQKIDDKIFNPNKISLKLLDFVVEGVSPYLQAEILLRRGLLFHFVRKLTDDAMSIYDRILELNALSDFNNPQLVSHVLYLKGLIQHDKNLLKQSLNSLNQAIELDKHNYAALILRGAIRYYAANQKLNELIVSFTKEYRAMPEDKQNSVVERSKFIPIWELERAFFEENEVYSNTIQDIENNLAAAYKIDEGNRQLKQTFADLLFYRGYGQRALKNTDLAELQLRRSYNLMPKNKTTILGASISNVLGQFYFEVWSAYLTSESITAENQADVNELLARALQLSEFVRDQLYDFVQKFIEDHPDLKPERLLPFYLTAKEIYPDWVPARRWLADYYRAVGAQDHWEEEFLALLKFTEDQDEWPALNLECSQIYLVWASYALRGLQNITDKTVLKKEAYRIQRLFEKSHDHNEVFARFGDSEFLYWQNRSILYQRWADLLTMLGDQEAWLEKINVAIESFEHYLNLETIDANNSALASLYRTKFLYLWRKNQAEWYADYAKWEKTAKTDEMIECMQKYEDWSLKPLENEIAKNKTELEELNKKLEGYKKSGFVKKINELVDEIAELKQKNDDLTAQLSKSQKVNGWLFNYVTVLQGVNAFQSGKYDDAMKVFLKSYSTIDSAYDAFWLGRISEIDGNMSDAFRWFMVSANKYPHALLNIAEILDENEKVANVDVLYLKTYLTLTKSLQSIEYIKSRRESVQKTLETEGDIHDSEALKFHLAKLDEILVETLVENSDASVLSYIVAQLHDIEEDHIAAFKHYFNAALAQPLFFDALFDAANTLFETKEYKHLSVFVLRLLNISFTFAEKNNVLEKLKEKTEKRLDEINKSLENTEFTEHSIEKSLKMLEQASEGANNPIYSYILGDVLVANKDFKNAEKKYKSANSSQLLFFPTYLAIAEMYNVMGNKPKAYSAYKEFLDILAQTGKQGLIAEIPERIRKNYNSILNEYNSLLKAGKSAYEAGDFKTAVKNLEECFKYIRSGTTAYILAGAYRELEDTLNAESWYLTTIQSQEIILHSYYDLAEMLENVPEKRWRAYWALGKLLEMIKDSEDPEVKKLADKARTMLERLNDIKNTYFTQGKELFDKGEFKKAYDSFLLSYNTNESPETAYFVGKSLLESWIKNFDPKKDIDLANLKDSEKWFILAAEAESGNALGYYELGTAYLVHLQQQTKTKEYYELFLTKTKDSEKLDIVEKRKTAQSFLNSIKKEIKTSLDDGIKCFNEGKYNLAYSKFLLNFRNTNSTETALWMARTLEKLKRFNLAQDWFLFAADELPEGIYELACMWNDIPVPTVKWVGLKYFETFIKLSENIEKLETLRKDALEKQKKLKADFDEFASKPVMIEIALIQGNIWAYNNLYEAGIMFFKNQEQWWLAHIYFNAFIKLVNDVELLFGKDERVKFEEKLKTAEQNRKILEERFDKAMKDGFKFVQNKENEKAIESFTTMLNIMRTFPADYSMLLALLENEKKYEDLILWSDRAVSFYGDSDSGARFRLLEIYSYVNAMAHFKHGKKETGIDKLKLYLKKWEKGKYVKAVKDILKSETQTKPN